MTTTTWTTAAGREPVNIRRVIDGTFSVVSAQALPLALLAAGFIVLPQALAGLLPESLKTVSLFVNLLGLIFNGAACVIAYHHLAGGQTISAVDAMRQAMRKFGGLWGMSIVSGLATAIGLLLLIAPGIFLLVCWMVAMPAFMVEDIKALASLDRSWKLTMGSRWRLAALLGILLLGAALGLLVIMLPAGVMGATLGVEATTKLSAVLLTPLFAALVTTFTAVGATSAYVELRRSAEGVLGSEIAAVFE